MCKLEQDSLLDMLTVITRYMQAYVHFDNDDWQKKTTKVLKLNSGQQNQQKWSRDILTKKESFQPTISSSSTCDKIER